MFDFLKSILSGYLGGNATDKKGKAQERALGEAASVEITEEDRLAGRLEFEFEMSQLQLERQIRLVGSPNFALTRLMELSGLETAQISNVISYAIIQDWNGTSCHKIEDYKAYSIFEDLVQKSAKGNYELCGMARSVTLYLEYNNTAGERGFFCAHFGVIGTTNKDIHLMNRVAILHKIPAKPQVYTNKIMITFDANDPQLWRDHLEEIHREADRKLQEKLLLTPDEEAVTGGSHNVRSLMARGYENFEAQAWSDALYYYLQVFRYLHDSVYQETAPAFVFNDMMEVCYRLGACYYNKGLYVKANYYLALASAGSKNPDIVHLMNLCNEQLKLFLKPEQSEVEKKMMSRLMFMLHFFFEITPQELSSLYWIAPAEQEEGLIDDPAEISRFDIREAMQHREDLVLHLSYRASSFVFDEGNTYDKSRLQCDNCIILQLQKREGVITVTAMLPQFNSCDVESYQRYGSLNFATEDICSPSAFEEVRAAAQQEFKNDEELCAEEVYALGSQKLAHYYHLNGALALHHNLLGDALYHEYIAQTLLLRTIGTAEFDDFDIMAWRDANYNIGFAFTQNHNYIPAIQYLAFVADCEDGDYMSEFFNSLTLERDIRSRVYLDTEYDKVVTEHAYPDLTGEERTKYIAYLKRRKGYVMTDQRHFNKAVPYLTSLLSDPLCIEFARNQLDYIQHQNHR